LIEKYSDTTYRKRIKLGKVGFVEFHSLRPRRIGRTLELQLKIVEGSVRLTVWKLSQRLESKQSVLATTRCQ